jgi:hypothetical protein
LRVLERLGLDLGQGVQIDFVASCCLCEGSGMWKRAVTIAAACLKRSRFMEILALSGT